MILCNDEPSGNKLIADPHVLPSWQINYAYSVAVFYSKYDCIFLMFSLL